MSALSSCSVYKGSTDIKCGAIPNNTTIFQVKSYVYEVVNGKRKRVSPFVFAEDGKTIVEIKQRAIINRIL